MGSSIWRFRGRSLDLRCRETQRGSGVPELSVSGEGGTGWNAQGPNSR